MIKTVLFDKDGTLFDFHATWAGFASSFILELSAGNSDRATEMADSVGFDLVAGEFLPGSVLIAGTPGDIAERLLPFLPGMTPAGLIARMNVLAANVPQAEVTPLVPLLTALRDHGYALGVITNDAMAPTESHLRDAGVSHLFDRIVSGDCGFGSKPSPGQIEAYLEMTGAVADQTVMIGDAPSDLVAARSAGVHGIGVLTGHATRSQLTSLARSVISDISEVPQLLRGWDEFRTNAA